MDYLGNQRQPVVTVADAATVTLPCDRGNRFEVTLAGTGRTLALSGDADGQKVEVIVRQDATGGRTITTWPAGVKWPGGTAPTLTSGANKADVIVLWRLAGGEYFGFVALNF